MSAAAPGRPKVAVVGYPNVGKSTLVNRLAGGRDAVVDPSSGVTRDRKEILCRWNGVEFDLIDTGGIDIEDSDQLARDVRGQALAAVAEAGMVLLVVDARAGLRPQDPELAEVLRPADVPTLVVANKVDRVEDEPLAAEFHALGLGEPAPVSATHGHRTGDLLDRVVEALGDVKPPSEEAESVGLAIIGRPNVGKSSLFNAFVGAERVVVSDRAGTTRDSIDTRIEVDGRPVVLVDTAGLRRRSKAQGVEYYSQLRAERAAARADVALLVCDATEGVTSEDLRIGQLAMREGCATVVALNKWDVGETDLLDATARIHQKLRLRPPVVAASALHGRAVPKLLDVAIALADRAGERIATSELNRFLAAAVTERPPPVRRGRRLKILYGSQVARRPPRFSIHVNDRRAITRDWAFFLENRLRDRYGLDGVPLVIDFVPRRGAPRDAASDR